eukprot:c11549_g1_i1.p1 GENE.c11549_g1_i1~~c11549_g1_i1.p1  ORF type:complete len:262 (-),score=36.91 c11549_g1_i1:9-794(-)
MESYDTLSVQAVPVKQSTKTLWCLFPVTLLALATSCIALIFCVNLIVSQNEEFQKVLLRSATLETEIHSIVTSSVLPNLVFLTKNNVGDFKISAFNSDHSGWLLCDGRDISRTQYQALFEVLGLAFGEGDHQDTFNLPNGAGRVAGITGQGIGLTRREMGTMTGEEKHALTTPEGPRHSHLLASDPAGGVMYPGDQVYLRNYMIVGWGTLGNENFEYQLRGNSGGPPPSQFKSSESGEGQPHNVMQPTVFLGNLFVYAGVA